MSISIVFFLGWLILVIYWIFFIHKPQLLFELLSLLCCHIQRNHDLSVTATEVKTLYLQVNNSFRLHPNCSLMFWSYFVDKSYHLFPSAYLSCHSSLLFCILVQTTSTQSSWFGWMRDRTPMFTQALPYSIWSYPPPFFWSFIFEIVLRFYCIDCTLTPCLHCYWISKVFIC